MNICMCGTQAGYPHTQDCPRPLYRGSEADQEQWERERASLAKWHRERMECGRREYSGQDSFGE